MVRRRVVSAIAASLLGLGCGDESVDRPLKVEGLTPAQRVAAGAYHTCALLRNGNLGCWGSNHLGQVGVSDGDDVYWSPHGVADTCENLGDCVLAPTIVRNVSGAIALSLGDRHSCALTGGGDVVCWGSNQFGQLGRGKANLEATPGRATLPGRAVSIAAGKAHTCAVTTDGAVFCWGLGSAGQLGRRL
jgi:alpha-tubulin suppressor-like RCC1 family protein